MESILSLLRMYWDHEPGRSSPPVSHAALWSASVPRRFRSWGARKAPRHWRTPKPSESGVALMDRHEGERAIGKANELYVPTFFFSSRRRHTRFKCDWSSDVCSSD